MVKVQTLMEEKIMDGIVKAASENGMQYE